MSVSARPVPATDGSALPHHPASCHSRCTSARPLLALSSGECKRFRTCRDGACGALGPAAVRSRRRGSPARFCRSCSNRRWLRRSCSNVRRRTRRNAPSRMIGALPAPRPGWNAPSRMIGAPKVEAKADTEATSARRPGAALSQSVGRGPDAPGDARTGPRSRCCGSTRSPSRSPGSHHGSAECGARSTPPHRSRRSRSADCWPPRVGGVGRESPSPTRLSCPFWSAGDDGDPGQPGPTDLALSTLVVTTLYPRCFRDVAPVVTAR